METFWIQGVVKNGQGVLETPLDLRPTARS
jgi:hypothetical protein